jgi:hypothetical protein
LPLFPVRFVERFPAESGVREDDLPVHRVPGIDERLASLPEKGKRAMPPPSCNVISPAAV